jgi:asparagine synthase (glutamine-hydrolysing)
MSQGIEIRSPFIDYRLMELAFTLPDHMKISEGVTKRVVRRAFGNQLPPRIINEREKIGFATPFDRWMESPAMRELVGDLVGSAEFGARRIWRADRLRARFSSPSAVLAPFPAWRYINVELWARRFGLSNI